MRVLMVEDATDLAETVSARFARVGIACDLAATVTEAEDHLAVQRYDALVLDINLPDGSGTDLLRRLRGGGDRTPVLMLTARGDAAAGTSQADAVLAKPFANEDLRALVRRMLA